MVAVFYVGDLRSAEILSERAYALLKRAKASSLVADPGGSSRVFRYAIRKNALENALRKPRDGID